MNFVFLRIIVYCIYQYLSERLSKAVWFGLLPESVIRIVEEILDILQRRCIFSVPAGHSHVLTW